MSNKTLLLFSVMFISFASSRALGQANTALSNLANPTAINRSLLPGSNNSFSLGSSTKNWTGLYVNGYLTIYNARTVTANPTKNNFWAGSSAGNLTATGTRNSGFGTSSLVNVSSGFANAGAGYHSLYSTTSGYENTAVGVESGRFNNTGYRNTYIGYNTGWSATIGIGLTFVGAYAGYSTPFSQYNSAFGFRALYSLANINYNSAFGAYAAESLVSSGYNSVFGYKAMSNRTSGGSNSVFGAFAGNGLSGNENVYVGYTSASSNRNSYNTFVGAYSGAYVKGGENTFIGYHSAGFVDSVKNSTALGYYTLISASNQVRIGDYRVTSIGGFQAWTNLSDGRFKKDVQENVPGLEFINKLRPITYTWKKRELDSYMRSKVKLGEGGERPTVEDDNTISTGFIAQEVEAAAKELKFSFDGVDAPKNDNDLYGLRYSEFVVPLVKAVQELSRKNDEKDSIIAVMMEKINELTLREGHGNILDSRAVLGQNYPNPVRQSTVIEYTLPEKSSYSAIALTDAAGKTLKHIVLGNNSKGNVTLNMGTLPSGIYNYSLIVDGKVMTTRKLTVVR